MQKFNVLFIGLSLLVPGLFQNLAHAASSQDSLIIHAAEWGVAKFHRVDNKAHPYAADHAWYPAILPDKMEMTDPSQTLVNADGSYTVFFSHLEALIQQVGEISEKTGKKIAVLNIHTHGAPGILGFPATAEDEASFMCDSWKDEAGGSDSLSFEHYYSPVAKEDIMYFRKLAKNPNPMFVGCATKLSDFTKVLKKYPNTPSYFTSSAVIHMLACLVGLDKAGQAFTEGLAKLFFPQGGGRIEASTYFGLGDWSLPEGMGFWDYQNDAQLEHDNSLYGSAKKDRDFMQKGTVRVSQSVSAQKIETVLLKDIQYMSTLEETKSESATSVMRENPLSENSLFAITQPILEPRWIHIPGTNQEILAW